MVKAYKSLMLLVFVLSLGCATSSQTPVTQINLTSLIGKWKGVMTVPAHGATEYAARLQSSVELEIFDASLKGRLTRFFTDTETKHFSFFGKIDDGKLVAQWKNGLWMKLHLEEKNGERILKGDHNFVKSGGSIWLEKIQ
jgi:hypothetical protein